MSQLVDRAEISYFFEEKQIESGAQGPSDYPQIASAGRSKSC
jgi:hypothetical protein